MVLMLLFFFIQVQHILNRDAWKENKQTKSGSKSLMNFHLKIQENLKNLI